MGGHQVQSHGSGDDGYDEDGYDESQRAEILEATRNGPSDGLVLTDLNPDLGDDDVEDESIDEVERSTINRRLTSIVERLTILEEDRRRFDDLATRQ